MLKFKSMNPPYSLQRPVGTKSIPPSKPLISTKETMDDEEFPQLPAVVTKNTYTIKSLTQKKSKNKKSQPHLIPNDPRSSSESIIQPLTPKEEMKEVDSLELPIDKVNDNINSCSKLPTSSKKTMNEQDSLQLIADNTAKDTNVPIKPITTPQKKVKKWRQFAIPLDIHVIPSRNYYRRNKSTGSGGAQAPPKDTSNSVKLLTSGKDSDHKVSSSMSPRKPTDSQTSTNPTTPTSPTSNNKKTDPIFPITSTQIPQKPRAAFGFITKKHQNRGFLYKYPPRERPYYAMIQCRFTLPSSNGNTINTCRFRQDCCFGHEEDRYFDSPWHVQRFVQGFNVELWESRTGLKGKQDLIMRREELMAIGEFINRQGMKGGHRKLVEEERAKRGLRPQTDDWCWAGRSYKPKSGSSPKNNKKSSEGQTVTGTSDEAELDWEDQTLATTSVSSQETSSNTDSEKFVREKTRLFQEHLRVETEVYRMKKLLIQQVRGHERKMQQDQINFENDMRERQEAFEREMYLRELEFAKFYRHMKLNMERRQYEERYQYQEQQRQYEALRHMSSKPIPRPPPMPLVANTAIQTVRYNKPIARPTPAPTCTVSRAVKSLGCNLCFQ